MRNLWGSGVLLSLLLGSCGQNYDLFTAANSDADKTETVHEGETISLPVCEKDCDTVFGSIQEVCSADQLSGTIYFLPERTEKLPNNYNAESLTKIDTHLCAKVLNVAPRDWSSGFPGIQDRFEWFAIRYTHKLQVTKAGTYQFRLNSDDGTRLTIGSTVVIDNDGPHPPKSVSGSVTLAAGSHDMIVEYYQGPRYQIALQLFVRDLSLSAPEKLFDASVPLGN